MMSMVDADVKREDAASARIVCDAMGTGYWVVGSGEVGKLQWRRLKGVVTPSRLLVRFVTRFSACVVRCGIRLG